MSAPSLSVRRSLAVGLGFLLAASFAGGTASAAGLTELPDALTITKSSNRNEVQYSVQVDEACAPSGSAPVRPYWRMLELGPVATAPLTDAELNVLGVDYQEVDGNRIQLTLKGFPGRKMAIETQRGARRRVRFVGPNDDRGSARRCDCGVREATPVRARRLRPSHRLVARRKARERANFALTRWPGDSPVVIREERTEGVLE
jgi:hypothetical protein